MFLLTIHHFTDSIAWYVDVPALQGDLAL